MRKVLVVVAAGLLTGFIITQISSKQTTSGKSSSVSPTPKASSSTNLPVDISNKDVLFAGVTYTFGGTVKNIEGEGSEYKIELQNSIKSMPELVTDERTTVVRREAESETPAALEDIERGERISVAALYDLRQKKWRVNRVFIIVRPPFRPQQVQ